MSTKLEPTRKLFRVNGQSSAAEPKQTIREKDTRLDSEMKSAAGNVQEELTPIRKSAGHAHTH